MKSLPQQNFDTTVELHLKLYLKRTQELWRIYNDAKEHWLTKNSSVENIPLEGSFPEVGITSFYRHGVGIRILCKEEIVEFDFIPKHVKKKDYLHIEEIDIYWSYIHYNSVHPDNQTTEEMWNEAISNLHNKKILTKFSWNRCALIGEK